MSAKARERIADRQQYLTVKCPCGFKGGAYLKHYDITRCDCGKLYWALQPERGGPFVLYPHPGFYKRE